MASKADAKADEATFVFTGTVKRLQAATLRAAPVDGRTAVVRVDQVLEAPKPLAHTAGQDITVQLAGRAKVEVGRQLMFHAAGWLFGEGVAVRAISQEPVAKRHQALLARGGEPVAHRMSRQVQQRVDAADLVVSGQVVSVHLPGGATMGPPAAGEPDTVPVSRRPVSEHDPQWREAVVAVAGVHKGQHDSGQVTVLFPASQDVRWFKSPKFEAGQKGFFLLHQGKMKPSEKAGPLARLAAVRAPGAEEPEVEVFTALHPLDFQPLAHAEVRQALGAKEP